MHSASTSTWIKSNQWWLPFLHKMRNEQLRKKSTTKSNTSSIRKNDEPKGKWKRIVQFLPCHSPSSKSHYHKQFDVIHFYSAQPHQKVCHKRLTLVVYSLDSQQHFPLLELPFSSLSMFSLTSTPWISQDFPWMRIHLHDSRRNDNASKTGKTISQHPQNWTFELRKYADKLHDLESVWSLIGTRENVVPSATKSRQRSPDSYFWSIVLQAARRCLETSTAVTEPESPRRSNIIQSLAPEDKRHMRNKSNYASNSW